MENNHREYCSFLKGLSIEEKNMLISCLDFDQKDIMIRFYENNEKVKDVGEEYGISRQALMVRKQKALLNLMRLKKMEPFVVDTKSDMNFYANQQALLNARKNAKKYLDKLDIKTEVLPNLNSGELYYFNNFLLGFNVEEFKKLAPTNLQASKMVNENVCKTLISRLNSINLKKNKIDNIYNLIGGKQNLEEFKNLLNEEELIVFEEYMLNINIKATNYVINNYGFTQSRLREKTLVIKRKIEKFAENKKNINRLIEKAGGEEVIIDFFIPLLSQNEYLVFINRILSADYGTDKKVCELIGIDYLEFLSVKRKVEKDFEEFIFRRPIVDALIENAGGIEAVYDNIISTLEDVDYKILLNYTLAYVQSPISKIAKEVGHSVDWVYKRDRNFFHQLKKLAEEKEKQNT